MHRAAAALVVALLSGACSGDGAPTPTSLPPTTAVPTPAAPTGTADVVRHFVDALGREDLSAAFALLTPAAQERAGGSKGFVDAGEERRSWARWADAASAAYDAVPVADGLAMVVLHGLFGEGDDAVLDATAVPVRSDGERWAVDAFGDVGPFEAEPDPGSQVGVEPTFALVVDEGVAVTPFVDGQPGEDVSSSSAGEGRRRVELHPNRPLRPGDHVVAAALVDGEGDAAARAVIYTVPE